MPNPQPPTPAALRAQLYERSAAPLVERSNGTDHAVALVRALAALADPSASRLFPAEADHQPPAKPEPLVAPVQRQCQFCDFDIDQASTVTVCHLSSGCVLAHLGFHKDTLSHFFLLLLHQPI